MLKCAFSLDVYENEVVYLNMKHILTWSSGSGYGLLQVQYRPKKLWLYLFSVFNGSFSYKQELVKEKKDVFILSLLSFKG